MDKTPNLDDWLDWKAYEFYGDLKDDDDDDDNDDDEIPPQRPKPLRP